MLTLQLLEVSNFAGIEKARLEFGPGLNVCHGPNEIGKSTLVKAIRAALLMQSGSAASSAFADWHADATPEVTLTFTTEPERIWRVTKRFGGGSGNGASYLESSKDGVHFTQDAHGREVDGRIAELLQWGIEPPGGKGRRRGLPESYIATALIGDQAAVRQILEQDIDEDPHESGKERLRKTLQGLAEDPAFRKILQQVQGRVDEAFTASGRRKTARGSPWVDMRERLKAAEDRKRELERQREESLSTREAVERLGLALLEARADLQRAEQALAEARQAAEQRKQIEQATTALQAANNEVERISQLENAVTEAREVLAENKSTLADAETEHTAAVTRVAEAANARNQAQAELRKAQSGEAEAQRTIERGELQKELLELDAARSNISTLIEQIERRGALQASLAETRTRLDEAKNVLQTAQDTFENSEAEIADQQCDLLAVRLLIAQERRDALIARTEEVAQLRQQAAAIVESTGQYPDEATISQLRFIDTELHVAEEKLGVGLSLTLLPEAPIDADVAVDSIDSELQRVPTQGATFEASSQIDLTLPGVARLVVRGGSGELQSAAESARQRWNSEVKPWLDNTGAATFANLESAASAAATDLRRAADLQARADTTEAQTQGDPESAAADADAAQSRLIEMLEEDADLDAYLGEIKAELLNADELEAAIEAKRDQLEQQRTLAAQLKSQVAVDESDIANLEAQLGDAEEAITGLGQPEGDDLASDPARLASEQERLNAKHDQANERLASLDSGKGDGIEAAEAAFQESEGEHDAAQKTLDSIDIRLKEQRDASTRAEERLKQREDILGQEDKPTALSLIESCQVALDNLPVPDDAPDIPEAETATREAGAEVHRLELILSEHEGALQKVGGDYAEEQARQAEEALEAARQEEHDLEVEYGAWQLLRDTMKDAEQHSAVHLGNAFVEPVSARLSALTQGRYNKVEISPQLQAGGVEIAGSPRDYDAMSLGTQEQLATIVRLAVAQTLESFLVMDDHLVQSDMTRMEALGDLLQEAARHIQVVVFTCRRDDYPDDGEPKAHFIDLAESIERRALGSGPVQQDPTDHREEAREHEDETNGDAPASDAVADEAALPPQEAPASAPASSSTSDTDTDTDKPDATSEEKAPTRKSRSRRKKKASPEAEEVDLAAALKASLKDQS